MKQLNLKLLLIMMITAMSFSASAQWLGVTGTPQKNQTSGKFRWNFGSNGLLQPIELSAVDSLINVRAILNNNAFAQAANGWISGSFKAQSLQANGGGGYSINTGVNLSFYDNSNNLRSFIQGAAGGMTYLGTGQDFTNLNQSQTYLHLGNGSNSEFSWMPFLNITNAPTGPTSAARKIDIDNAIAIIPSIDTTRTSQNKKGGLELGKANSHTGDRWISLGTSVTRGAVYIKPLLRVLNVDSVNLGVSGSDSYDFANHYSQIPTLTTSNKDNYRLISFETGGINDPSHGVTATQMAGNLRAAIAHVKGKGWTNDKILLISSNYVSRHDLVAVGRAYSDSVKNVAKTAGVQFFSAYDYIKNNGGDSLLSDSIHPTEYGGLVYARGLSASIYGGLTIDQSLMIVNGADLGGSIHSYKNAIVDGYIRTGNARYPTIAPVAGDIIMPQDRVIKSEYTTQNGITNEIKILDASNYNMEFKGKTESGYFRWIASLGVRGSENEAVSLNFSNGLLKANYGIQTFNGKIFGTTTTNPFLDLSNSNGSSLNYGTSNVLVSGGVIVGKTNGTTMFSVGTNGFNIGNTGTAGASTIFQVSSTTKGSIAAPIMSNAQMLAIATPVNGMMVYDGTNGVLNWYQGGSWIAVVGTSSTQTVTNKTFSTNTTWNGGVIGALYGGTGLNTYAIGDMLYASSTTGFAKVPIGANKQVLSANSGAPVWTTIESLADTTASLYRTKANSLTLAQLQTKFTLKQNALSGTGFVKSAGGTITYDTNTYLTSETDPSVPSNVKSITGTNISNWNTAYGWGNHSSAGYAANSAVVHNSGDEIISGYKRFVGDIGVGSHIYGGSGSWTNSFGSPGVQWNNTDDVSTTDRSWATNGGVDGDWNLWMSRGTFPSNVAYWGLNFSSANLTLNYTGDRGASYTDRSLVDRGNVYKLIHSETGYVIGLVGSGNGSSTTITIPHGLTGIDSGSIIVLTPNTAAAAKYTWASVDGTNAYIHYDVAPASGSQNLSYSAVIKYQQQ